MIPFGRVTLFMLPRVSLMLFRHKETAEAISPEMNTGQGKQ